MIFSKSAAISLAILMTAFLTGCSNGNTSSSMTSQGQNSAAMIEQSGPVDSWLDKLPDEEQQSASSNTFEQINSAIGKIGGFEDMPDDCLVGVKGYFQDMKWMEVNQIEHLERYNILDNGIYLLFIPRYAHSKITVQPIEYRDGEYILAPSDYVIEDCPDNYALIVNREIDYYSDKSDLRITITFEEQSVSYDFIWDGIIGIPEDTEGMYYINEYLKPNIITQTSGGTFFAYSDYGHTKYGDFISFRGELPVKWEKSGVVNGIQSYIGDVRIDIWGYYCTPENSRNVKSFMNNKMELTELTTPNGNLFYRAFVDGNNLSYAFMADNKLCVMVDMRTITGAGAHYAVNLHDDEMKEFVDSFKIANKVSGKEDDSVPAFQEASEKESAIEIKTYVQLTDGAKRTAATTVTVGDSFLGWTADKIEYYDDGNMILKFSGEVTLKCRLSYPALDEPFGNVVSAYVTNESLSLLPYPAGDKRDIQHIWFILDNSEEVIQSLGGKAFEFSDCEIVIEGYTVHRRPAGVSDVATVQSINYAH